jgi:hypothetical protein
MLRRSNIGRLTPAVKGHDFAEQLLFRIFEEIRLFQAEISGKYLLKWYVSAKQ